MPLVKCPDCGHDVSPRAEACPHCGCPAKYFEAPQAEEVSIGSIVHLGSYAGEQIAWKVMEIDDGKALLVSEKALEVLEYHNSKEGASWAECSLRTWLNGEFLADFSEADLARISETENEGDCLDKAFCLSPEEMNICFNSKTEVLCPPTTHAMAAGALTAEDNGACCWWLRSHESAADSQLFIITSGEAFSRAMIKQQSGADIAALIMKKIAVRPAIWINC